MSWSCTAPEPAPRRRLLPVPHQGSRGILVSGLASFAPLQIEFRGDTVINCKYLRSETAAQRNCSTKKSAGADEPKQGEEVVSSVATVESADKSCDNSKVDESVEEPTKLQEGEIIHFTHAVQNPSICSLMKTLD